MGFMNSDNEEKNVFLEAKLTKISASRQLVGKVTALTSTLWDEYRSYEKGTRLAQWYFRKGFDDAIAELTEGDDELREAIQTAWKANKDIITDLIDMDRSDEEREKYRNPYGYSPEAGGVYTLYTITGILENSIAAKGLIV